MADADDEDIEFHFVTGERSLEAITQRLREMQRELDRRPPVDPGVDDDEGPNDPAGRVS